LGVPLNAKVNIDDTTEISVNRWLLKGMSDKEPVKGFNPATEQHKLRRVDVIIASSPAGLSEFPSGISKKKQEKLNTLILVDEPKKVQELLDTGTPCEKQLAKKAFR
jgi:hypothetical protein